MKDIFFTVLVFLNVIFFTQSAIAQNNNTTLEEQFNTLIDGSSSYQEFKIVKKVKLNELKKSFLDSIVQNQLQIKEKSATILELQSSIDSLTTEVNLANDSLTISKQKEEGISFFGMLIKKATYQLLMGICIGLLLVFLVVVFFKFKNSNRVTKETREKLKETEKEFDEHRQRALEREQQLRRKLQDEINKQKKT